MDIPLKYKSLKISKIDEATNLSNEIFEGLNRKLGYANIRRMINEIGVRATTDLWIITKKLDGKYNKCGFFIKEANKIKQTIKYE